MTWWGAAALRAVNSEGSCNCQAAVDVTLVLIAVLASELHPVTSKHRVNYTFYAVLLFSSNLFIQGSGGQQP